MGPIDFGGHWGIGDVADGEYSSLGKPRMGSLRARGKKGGVEQRMHLLPLYILIHPSLSSIQIRKICYQNSRADSSQAKPLQVQRKTRAKCDLGRGKSPKSQIERSGGHIQAPGSEVLDPGLSEACFVGAIIIVLRDPVVCLWVVCDRRR